MIYYPNGMIKKLVCETRHYNISCIFNTQSYKNVPRVVRINCRGLILFPSSLGEMEKFSEENARICQKNDSYNLSNIAQVSLINSLL